MIIAAATTSSLDDAITCNFTVARFVITCAESSMSIESIWLDYFNKQTSNLMLGGLNVVCILYSKSNVSLSTKFMRSKERKKNKIKRRREARLDSSLSHFNQSFGLIGPLHWLLERDDCYQFYRVSIKSSALLFCRASILCTLQDLSRGSERKKDVFESIGNSPTGCAISMVAASLHLELISIFTFNYWKTVANHVSNMCIVYTTIWRRCCSDFPMPSPNDKCCQHLCWYQRGTSIEKNGKKHIHTVK